MAEECPPRGCIAARPGSVVFGQNTSHDILVNIYVKGLRYDQRHARAPESRIPAFELHDDSDELFAGSLGARFRLFPRREKRTVVPTNQTLAQAQKRRWPDGDGDFVDPATGEKQGTNTSPGALDQTCGGVALAVASG